MLILSSLAVAGTLWAAPRKHSLSDAPPPIRWRKEEPEVSKRHLELILSLEKQGAALPEIFRNLCAQALEGPKPLAEMRDIFGSLYHWTEAGGKPSFQGRQDLALHLIYGGVIEAYVGQGQGEVAGRAKEERDAETPGNAYDLDDLAATLVGAELAARAYALTPEQFRAWLAPWARSRRGLGALAPLIFGRLPPRRLATNEQIEAARDYARTVAR